MTELDMIRILLDEAPPSAEVFAEGHRRIAAAGSVRPGRPNARWAVAGTGLAAAAAIAAAITLGPVAGSPGASPGASASPTDSSHGRFVPATTPSAVLRNAALAALELPAGAPKPGQFVYTKLYRQDSTGAPGRVVRIWASADGARLGLEDAGVNDRAALPACQDGHWVGKAVGQPARRMKLSCTPGEGAAYQSAMPVAPAALRRYLTGSLGLWPGDSGGLLTGIETLMTHGYQTPAQWAALYRLLAQTPGLSVVPDVANVKGQTGVGVRSRVWKSAIYTIIFSPRTYAPLGMDWTVVTGPVKGERGGEVVLRKAIVGSTPTLP